MKISKFQLEKMSEQIENIFEKFFSSCSFFQKKVLYRIIQ